MPPARARKLPGFVSVQVIISQSVVASGGAMMDGGDIGVTATVGQPVIGITSNGNEAVQSGFWYGLEEVVTRVEETQETVPTEFKLVQNYPNPFNPTTTIQYSIASATHVTLRVYDMLGREVATLVDEEMQPGSYQTTFSAAELPSGLYFYRIQAADFQQVRKLTVVK